MNSWADPLSVNLRRLGQRSLENARRNGHNEAIATAIAMRAILDHDPSLTISDAYELVMRGLGDETPRIGGNE